MVFLIYTYLPRATRPNSLFTIGIDIVLTAFLRLMGRFLNSLLQTVQFPAQSGK
jgi:hypothetical protein